MAQAFTKNKLSASTNGKSIKVTWTNTAWWVTLHTSVAWTTHYDEVYIYATNTSASAVDVTIEFGWTTSPDDTLVVNLPAKSWPILIVPWFILNNSLLVKAFAWTANVITINGYVHNIVNS